MKLLANCQSALASLGNLCRRGGQNTLLHARRDNSPTTSAVVRPHPIAPSACRRKHLEYRLIASLLCDKQRRTFLVPFVRVSAVFQQQAHTAHQPIEDCLQERRVGAGGGPVL